MRTTQLRGSLPESSSAGTKPRETQQIKVALDQRVQQGKEVHGNNTTIKFMKENYRKICETRPKKEPSADGPPEMVPETTWIDVASENEITKALQCLNLNAVKKLLQTNTRYCRKY